MKAVVHATLDRYGDRLRRVDVHLSDAVGDKTGHEDKCCMIEVRRDGREAIVVMHQESTLEQAIQGAIHNLKSRLRAPSKKEAGRNQFRNHP